MWIYSKPRLINAAFKLSSLLFALTRVACGIGEFGIDKGTISCSEEEHKANIKGQKGDFGAITSSRYPQNYTADLYFGVWCEVEVKSCSTCKLRLEFSDMTFPSCVPPDFDLSIFGTKVRGSKCIPGCDHLYVVETDKPYDAATQRAYYKQDEGAVYKSLSSSVVIVHCMSNATVPTGKRFHVQYIIEDKQEAFSGSVASSPNWGAITSPNFPDGYALNGETFTYFIQNLDPYGHIKIVFDDWDIDDGSEVQVYDGLIDSSPAVTLSSSRRPALVSESNKVVIVFNTGTKRRGCCGNSGFRATYQYISDKSAQQKPRTDCSSISIMKSGGTILFSGSPTNIPFYFDCIWVIKKDPSVKRDGTQLRLEEVVLGKGWMTSVNNSLEIREGVTSLSPLIIRYTSKNITHDKKWTSLDSGYYVRLRGMFSSADRMKIIYTSFNNITDTNGCPGYFEYLCHNLMCIAQDLMCDGVNHCGDESDEIPNVDCSMRDLWKMKLVWTLPYNKEDGSVPVDDGLVPIIGNACGDDFQCNVDHQCVPQSKRCDQTIDCSDASDEYQCSQQDYTSSEEYLNGYIRENAAGGFTILHQCNIYVYVTIYVCYQWL